MNGKKKTPKAPGFMRQVLAVNVSKLMEHHYRESGNKPRALAKDAGVSLSTIQRMLKAENGATIDNIEAVASAFRMSAYQLLLPMLDVQNPPIVQGAPKDEERLRRRWQTHKSLLTGEST
jgi:transcriptional regulator with XRE-family HTH domain